MASSNSDTSGRARTAVVTGGGPVGAATAILLAQHGWSVQVFEKASMPSGQPSQHDQRAYRLTMTVRALRVLKLLNVNVGPLITTQGKFFEAAMFKADGAVFMSAKVPMADDPPCLRAFRDEVSLCVIKSAQQLYPHAIKFHFNAQVQEVNLTRQTVSVSFGESTMTQANIGYDLLVGADGAASAVRLALQQIMPASYVRRYRHKQVYSMTQMTPANPAKIPPYAVFHAHSAKEGIVLWDARGADDCRVGLVVPQECADALRQGQTEETVAMLNASCPALPDYVRKAVMELACSKPCFYPMPSWTYLSQFHGPKTVLLGDAAHTMSPVMGQGLNSGLEDVGVFAECLQQHQDNVDMALPAYTQQRLPDVQAIMTINEVVASSEVGLRVQDQDAAHYLWILGHKILLMVHVVLRTVLHKAVPSMFSGPLVASMVQGSLPYRALTSAMYKDSIVFAAVLLSFAAFWLHR
ncbi:hypothetical protein ABBQ38_008341 [Trebouxia sp. C0009 RCD-2024]